MAKTKTVKEAKEEPLEKQLWKAADKLRKNIDAAEYKHVVLGLSGAENFLSFAHGQQLTLNKALKPLFCVVNQPYSQ
jgi:hypothetical protein